MKYSKYSCAVCGSNNLKLLYVTRDFHYGISGSWKISKCTLCELVQLNPMLSSKDLINLYPPNFYAYDINRHANSFKFLLKKVFFGTLIVKDPLFDEPGKILDYGCGVGWALNAFKIKGWTCFGYEPNEKAANSGSKNFNLKIFTGSSYKVLSKFKTNSIDYIRANHSLEHDPDVNLTLKQFKRLIKKRGKLLIGVPNYSGLTARIFGKYWWYIGAPVHTYNFSKDNLIHILNKHNFEIESIRYAGNYTGVCGSLQIYFNRKNHRKLSNEGFIINNPFLMLTGQMLAMITNFFKCGDAIEIVAKPYS
jgi:SAM-dependent methyltransferase